MGAWNRLGEVLPAWFRILSATADPGEYDPQILRMLLALHVLGVGNEHRR